MSQDRVFSILGDSNVQRHMNPMNCRDRPLMTGAQVIPCGRLSLLSAALGSIRPESTLCIMSCITNFITSSSASDSVSIRSEPVMLEFLEKLSQCCEARPDLTFLVCPPMYRRSPIWYREGLPEILMKFSNVMLSRPASVLMMPSFSTPSFESDGVHLSAYSGLAFVLHLFDSANHLIDVQGLNQEAMTTIASESTRVLEDRVMVLEQDHHRLNSMFELKSAIDAELSDFQENIRNEHFFMIQGLKRLPKLEPKEWQDQAKKDVNRVVAIILGRDCQVSYIKNSTGKGKEAKTLYRVAVATAGLSKEIRDKFGSYFLGGKGFTGPESLKGLSVRNCVTTATLARIAILQTLGQRYVDSNPGSSYKSIGYDPRPLLKLFPARDASDQRVQTFNFIEAVTRLPTCFSESEIEALLNRISPKLHGHLKSILIVLSDDMLPKTKPKAKSKTSPSNGETGATSSASGLPPATTPPARSGSGNRSRSGKRSHSGSGSKGPSAKK